jgi:hypothetical protein
MSSDRDPAGSEAPPSAGSDAPSVQPTEHGERDDAGASAQPAGRLDSHNMLPPRERRRSRLERLLVRLIATCGIVAIGVAIAAIMVSNKSQGWIVGLVVSIVSVVLAAILWSSRQV